MLCACCLMMLLHAEKMKITPSGVVYTSGLGSNGCCIKVLGMEPNETELANVL